MPKFDNRVKHFSQFKHWWKLRTLQQSKTRLTEPCPEGYNDRIITRCTLGLTL